MAEINDLMAEIPEELLDGEVENEDDTQVVDDAVVEDEAVDNEDAGDESEENDDEGASDDDQVTDEDDDDYIIAQANEEPKTASDIIAPDNAPKAAETSEGQYILEGLTPISVRIINAKDEVETVKVYGWGDLPRDYKGIATPYEQGVFASAVQSQEFIARQRQAEFRNNQQLAQQQKYEELENQAIRDDLTELRQDGLFPKFKGEPGTKEFNNSDGAKEFDRVIAYMNDYNDRALEASQRGKAYRHIGFKEAFTMLNGANPRAAEQREQKARTAVAQRTASRRGGSSNVKQDLPRVTNINDLAAEFDQFVGSNA